MAKDQILAIDNGTQSVRALIFDLKGQLIAKNRVPIQPYYSVKPGWAEQDPDVFWQGVCQACQEIWAMEGVDKDAIVGVGLTTQRSTLINLDKNQQPLRPAVVWLDQRRTEGLPPVGGVWGLLFKLAGMSETVRYFQAEAEANWIKTHQPEIWKRTDKFVLLSGFLTHKLVGKVIDSIGCQVAYIPFDYKNQDWAKPSDWKWQAIRMDREQLPDLVPPAQWLGHITREAAEATGIPEGLPLIATAADKATEVIGAGCLEPHIGCLSFGTTATINTTHTKYTEVIPLIPPYPAAVPGAYSLEVQIYRGFWMVSWFKEEFGLVERREAEKLGVEAEVLFDNLLQTVPAGAEGLMLQPYWSPGLKIPGPEAKGAVIGFGDVHTRAHFYRAIIEGLGYALLEGMQRTEKRSKIPITELRVAGGGSQSPGVMQITADIFGLPVTRPHVYEASGLGAAIDVAVGLGLHPDFNQAVSEMTHLGDTFEPDPHRHKIYTDLYERVYQHMYKRLQPLYNEIREIVA
ncbi:MAG: L-xylulose/3-keto-L-gulonate kinase [Chloroflexi bacterium ADurb.Bin120]|jgi:sugar (pentulose or hexulose) kinase|uniref:Putative carbohydrate kinase n=1 Tax=Candidatus Brevifilum fermentans TaxID=1986204 RepID=A0A1Y6K9F7_9CHLR|nr:FGGY-family carbohydrate kinase [Brevefilum fermentans]OQB85065.1 MAG: L-xylulose/3-keto-L-gulonate kinase [Chloroflexi bacterium ADurb.Bin120]SMX54660.1 putative carbohydrate kinase [Brevefilum fermentans]HOM66970.1 FGGY-family carbohydrate kinase [Brevefilum fermentans]